MALTQYYVKPVTGLDTNTGAIGSPWKTVQHALNTIVQGAAGDQININSEGDDVLSATLSLATYGTPTNAKPLIFSGYTSAANDGGIGGISGNSGGFTILTSGALGIKFQYMHLHHCGAAGILSLTAADCLIDNCELDHSTSGTAVGLTGSNSTVSNCYFHDITGTIAVSASNLIYNYLNCAATTTVVTVSNTAQENAVLASVAGGVGIRCNGAGVILERNSVYNSAAGTVAGIQDNAQSACVFIDNIVEGWSGAGGKGIQSTGILALRAGNRAFNCTTAFSVGVVVQDYGTDTTPAASDFNNAAGGDLTLVAKTTAKATGFPGTYRGSAAPVNTSYRDKGAFQSQLYTVSADEGGMIYQMAESW